MTDDPFVVITVTQATDGGPVNVDTGDLDPFSAYGLLRVAMDRVYASMPDALMNGEEALVDEDDE